MIDELREELRHRVSEPRRWAGSLRRLTFARAVQASNSIEGYNATLDDVVAAVDGDDVLDASAETASAVSGYRDAMTYVLQHAHDETAKVDEGLLKALHFMMIKHDLAKNPGRWRPGAIWVRREPEGAIVYEGPPSDEIPALIVEMIRELERSDAPVLFRAAVAHLNLVMIHPFSDGNGRMARALQTLVLAREQIVAPVFSSIEEYLGRNTQAYYDVLAQVGEGAWHPENDARPWVRFCLTAHYRQGRTHLRRVQEVEELWLASVALAERHRLPERAAAGLMDAAYGLRVRNARYRASVDFSSGEEISELTATRDLKAMVEAGLLTAVGERRGRFYVASDPLLQARQRIRAERPTKELADPFTRASEQLSLEI
ncbi:Fic family protein [Solirubrobacter phytolaccae]|uniref:Fic family protein n=1 Tax=Solirubrobacter phytolaccae TaxID=1404360 RepID=A0A9X3N3J8_9ACTN|nr:Fic family protein [Solirubrobacter phytolaccae]MDA0178949.1 Fic family protein [Solirubrobacter phytolaccae]